MFGSSAFGICETTSLPCLYLTAVAHPLDRLIQVYFNCLNSPQHLKHSLCSFSFNRNRTLLLKRGHVSNDSQVTSESHDLLAFIKTSGNVYFKKLLYYSKFCKLVGTDQVCIRDSHSSFILSPEERKVLLQDVLENLGNWFAVVGMIEHYKDTLQLFEFATGLKFTQCNRYRSQTIDISQTNLRHFFNFTNDSDSRISVREFRNVLLKQVPNIKQWLIADLKIYQKIKEIFQQQKYVFAQTLQCNNDYPSIRFQTYQASKSISPHKHIEQQTQTKNTTLSSIKLFKNRSKKSLVQKHYASHHSQKSHKNKKSHKSIKERLKDKRKQVPTD